MKKTLVIAAVNIEIIETYMSQLKSIFADLVEIKGYLLGREDQKIKGDLIVVSMQSTMRIAEIYREDPDVPILWLHTTFAKKSIKCLKLITKGKRVLLVSKFWFYVVESINLLKEMGINHIEMIPYYPEIEGAKFENVDTIVEMGLDIEKPKYIKNVIDLGWRVINPTCIEKIVTELEFNNKQLLSRIEEYKNKTVPIDTDRFIKAGFDSETCSKINAVINALDQGILLVDPKNKIIAYNQYLCNLLNIPSKRFLKKDVCENKILNEIVIHARKNNLHKSVYYNHKLNKRFLVSRKDMVFQYQKYNDVIILDEIKDNVKSSVTSPTHLNAKYSFSQIIGESHQLKETIELAIKYSKIDSPILIVGGTGTGKELFAHSIHNESNRRDRPFLAINCASMPSQLLESELFGYESGSFTGALKKGKQGLFELADGGTIFLDEIGDAKLDFQVKLLRVLQEREITRIGGTIRIPVDVRIIAATNKDIRKIKKEGLFRKDLFYRLSAMILNIPDLNARKNDIPLLSRFFLNNIGASEKIIHEDLRNFLISYQWEGNVRELKNCIEYLGYFGNSALTIADLPKFYKNNQRILENSYFDNDLIKDMSKKELEVVIQILEILEYEKSGRNKILALIKNSGKEIKEYKIRKMLEMLSDNNFIESVKGRRGSKITGKGKSFLEFINKKNK